MDRYQELLELVQESEVDFFKFYKKGNKTAGVRLRKRMQEIRAFALDVRNEVQTINKNNAEDLKP